MYVCLRACMWYVCPLLLYHSLVAALVDLVEYNTSILIPFHMSKEAWHCQRSHGEIVKGVIGKEGKVHAIDMSPLYDAG